MINFLLITFTFLTYPTLHAKSSNPQQKITDENKDIPSACSLLNNPIHNKNFLHLKDYLCASGNPGCEKLNEAQCAHNRLCRSVMGSGSGPNCSPCTPDRVFWHCEAYTKQALADVILMYRACVKFQEIWNKSENGLGHCSCKNDELVFNLKLGCKPLRVLCEAKKGTWRKSAEPSKYGTSERCFVGENALEYFELLK